MFENKKSIRFLKQLLVGMVLGIIIFLMSLIFIQPVEGAEPTDGIRIEIVEEDEPTPSLLETLQPVLIFISGCFMGYGLALLCVECDII